MCASSGQKPSKAGRAAKLTCLELSHYQTERVTMDATEYDTTKLDEIVLALLHLNAFTDHGVTRAWKGFDWDTLDRPYQRGLIGPADPAARPADKRPPFNHPPCPD